MAIGKSRLHKMLENGLTLSIEDAWLIAWDNAEFREWVLDLIRINQLFDKGEDKDGNIIGVYSEYTEILNPEKIAGTHYTLKDTGYFFGSLFIDDWFSGEFVTIDGDGEKDDDDLFEKFGEGIIGINQENLSLVRQEIKKKFIKYVKETLFRGI